MNNSTQDIRNQLSVACNDLIQCVTDFRIQCGLEDWKEKVVTITSTFKEIFPGVMAKVAFPVSEDSNSTIILKAKAGSKLDLHKMLPLRFVYIVHGDQRDETGVIVLNEDEGMVIKPLQESAMYFGVDTKLIMQLENEQIESD